MPVSVIIPAVNEAEHIATAIGRAWTAGAGEVIVADGGSRDGTVDIARGCDCVLVQTARGRAIQQNAAAARARGDVLLFLHADTWLAERAIGQIEAALADARRLGGAFEQRIEADGLAYRVLERTNALRARWLRRPFGDQGIFMRREVFERLGGFPEAPLMEDVLLMRRFARLARPLLLPGPLFVSARRWQRHGVVRQTARNWLLIAAHQAGVSTRRLARFYPAHDKSP